MKPIDFLVNTLLFTGALAWAVMLPLAIAWSTIRYLRRGIPPMPPDWRGDESQWVSYYKTRIARRRVREEKAGP